MQRIQLLSTQLARLNLCSNFASVNVAKQSKRLPHGFNRPTAYSLFVKDNFISGKKVPEETSRLASLWKSLDESNKKMYVDQAEKIASDRVAAFNKLSKAEQSVKLAESDELRKKRKENRRLDALREFRAKTGHPKRPGNAIALFLKDFIQKKSPSNKDQASKAFQEGCAAWKSLSESDKKPYIDQTREASEKYAVNVKKWKKEHGAAYDELLKSFSPKKKPAKKAKSTGLRTRSKRTRKTAKSRSGSRKKVSAKKV